MGGRIVKVALIAPDFYGLQTIYFEQPDLHRTMSLNGFTIVAIQEVECQYGSNGGDRKSLFRAT
jgi:hypothetical protein